MKPWIATTLAELEQAAAAAYQRSAQLNEVSMAAEEAARDAHENWLALQELLKDFRQFADAQPEGGAP